MYKHKDGIHLRKVHKGDLYALLDLKGESWWGTHGTPIINLEDQVRWYENISSRELFMIASREVANNLAPIGIACYTEIDWICHSLSLSGSIFKPCRTAEVVKPAFSAGLDFAFEVLNMRRVQAEVLETHAAAQQLEIGHLGMVVEGRRRKAVYKAGRYYDSIMLSILRDEWENQERVKSYNGCCNDNFDHEKAEKNIRRLNRVLDGDGAFQ